MQKSSTTLARRVRARRTVAVLLAVAFAGAGVGYYLTAPVAGAGEAAEPSSSTSTGVTAPGSGATGARPAGQATSTSTAAQTPGPTATGDQATGPGLSEPGVTLVASPREDGSWDVVEYVVLARSSDRLDLSRARVFAAGGEFAQVRAQSRELQVTADGEVAGLVGRGTNRHVQAAAPTTSYVLRYVLDGATVRSVPSKAGRALTALAPIADPGNRADRVQIVVNGEAVRALQCPLLEGDAQLCAAGETPRLYVRQALPRRTAVALVQFDLPKPR